MASGRLEFPEFGQARPPAPSRRLLRPPSAVLTVSPSGCVCSRPQPVLLFKSSRLLVIPGPSQKDRSIHEGHMVCGSRGPAITIRPAQACLLVLSAATRSPDLQRNNARWLKWMRVSLSSSPYLRRPESTTFFESAKALGSSPADDHHSASLSAAWRYSLSKIPCAWRRVLTTSSISTIASFCEPLRWRAIARYSFVFNVSGFSLPRVWTWPSRASFKLSLPHRTRSGLSTRCHNSTWLQAKRRSKARR